MKKKVLIFTVLIAIMLCVLVGCSPKVGKNIIENGNFDSANDSDIVSVWKNNTDTSSFVFKANINDGSDFYLPELGKKFAYLTKSSGIQQSDYIYQTVKLQKGKTYKLSAKMRVESIAPTNKIGARIGFLEDEKFVGINVYEKTAGWEDFEIYFTSESSKDMTLICTLGNAKNSASGSIYFDNVVLTRVNKVPASYVGEVGNVIHKDDTNLVDAGAVSFVVILAIVTVVFLYGMYFVIRKVSPKTIMIGGEKQTIDYETPKTEVDNSKSGKIARALISPFAIFIYIMLGAFVLRFALLLLTYGLNKNVDAMSDIGAMITNNSFVSIMTGKNSTNHPMGLVYIMSLLGSFAGKLGIEYGSLGYSVLVRIPAIISDIVLLYIIFGFVQKHKGDKLANTFAAIYAFTPILFIYGVMYGSMQIVALPFIVAMFVAMLDKKYISSGIYYTLSLLFSHYALLLLPIILVYQIYGLVKEKDKRIEIGATMIGCFIFFYAMSIVPCFAEIKNGNIFFIFKKMYAFFETQTLLSTDTFNLYGIFAGVNVKTTSTLLTVANWLFVIAMAGLIVAAFIKTRNRLDLIMLSSVMFVAYSAMGAKSNLDIMPIALILLLIYMALVPDRRLFGIFVGFSTISFVNVAQVMAVNGVINNNSTSQYIALMANSPLMIIFSVLSLLLAVYYIYVAIDIVALDSTSPIPPLERKFKDEITYLASFKWAKKK